LGRSVAKMTWHESEKYIAKYVLGMALILLLSGGILQVFVFNYDSDVQTQYLEYESVLHEYQRMNIYYTPEESAIPSLGYPTFLPLLMMFLGIAALAMSYFNGHKDIDLEKTERERLEKLVDERTKSLQLEILEHENTQRALKESERRYRSLFEDSAVSLWVEDYSGVKEVMDNLQSSGITDLRAYFKKNEDELLRCADLVKILDVNKATLSLHGFSDKKEILGPLSKILNSDSKQVFLDQIIALYLGNLPFESDTEELTVTGDKKSLILQLTVPPGYQDTWTKVYLAIIDVTERKKEENRIAASLAEKELLLKEIHHRVKNNLQIISSLLYLQSNRIADNEIVMALRESEQRIKSMSLIHEVLYKSDDLARIDFEKYINELTGHLARSFGVNESRVIFNVDIKEKFLGIDIAIPCGLIVNELVSNSLKYAFPDDKSGQIGVCLKSIDDEILELSVIDNGIGMPDDFDLSRDDTLGLQLVRTLAERQLHGTFKLDDTEKTRYVIQFKKEQGVK
jgi:two-component sensor histidine kinase/PAS domain-containing protein